MDSLSDVAVFVQVVDSQSFTAAAEKLGLSKSVVSKYVTRLEDRLGARLLNRTTRRLSLTEVGRAFYDRSREGLREIEAAEQEVSRLQAEPRGVLRINSPMSFGILHIAPALTEFQNMYPDLHVDMSLDDRRLDLVEEGFDVAIRIGDLPDSSLVARRLGDCRHVVCGAPGYFARYGTPRSPEDLRDHRTLTFKYHDSPSEWRFLAPEGGYVSVGIDSAIQLNNSLAIREAVLHEAGITLTPTFVVGEDIQQGRLRAILQDYRAMELSIYALYPQRRHLSPKVRAFIEFMSERIHTPAYWEPDA
ncbi:MAG: LysR family transcriptional regulator [Gammaproteobacteria bacterium]|nr:LysR family transcriptional regulator [Gammaproteobacteria bacterium]MDX5374814.1 LysR family transcriptional regulator [Gammaproteobacteria bacterium]